MTATPAPSFLATGRGKLTLAVLTAIGFLDFADASIVSLAAVLLNAAQQLGGALGLAMLSAIATARTNHLIDRHDLSAHAMTAGFQRALLVGGLSVLAATAFGLRTRNSRGGQGAEPMVAEPELAAVPQPT